MLELLLMRALLLTKQRLVVRGLHGSVLLLLRGEVGVEARRPSRLTNAPTVCG